MTSFKICLVTKKKVFPLFIFLRRIKKDVTQVHLHRKEQTLLE